ncbi:MAG: alpha-L-arabinofuranosidase, partial [Bacteroidales bacterium]|nr:alpha-L-arabinofuranosidase [Bacteroidales bacterium]
VEGWQWRPDLIWYDNLRSMRTVSWHVQQLYGQYKGENVLKLTMDGKAVTGAEGQNGLFASAVKDGDLVYVKVANTSEQDQELALNFNEESGLKAVKRIVLKSEELYEDNTLDNPDAIVPVEASFTGNGKSIKAEVPALSFTIFVLSR